MLGAALLYNLMLAEKRASSGNDGAGSQEGLVGHYRNALGDWYGEVEDKRRTKDQWVAEFSQLLVATFEVEKSWLHLFSYADQRDDAS